MAPLSAASMEKGSYLRGYEHLTRLVWNVIFINIYIFTVAQFVVSNIEYDLMELFDYLYISKRKLKHFERSYCVDLLVN